METDGIYRLNQLMVANENSDFNDLILLLQ